MDAEEKSNTLLNTVPLLEAVLCADCEVISDSNGEACPVCGSRSLLSVARVLGGSTGQVRATVVEAAPEPVRNTFTVLVNPEASNVLREKRRRRKQASLFEPSGT